MAVTENRTRLDEARQPGFGIGLLKGMRVLLRHLFKRTTTIQYPDERQDLSPRTRGVIALKEENCTVCMLCGRECPDWCIYIDSHKETLPPKREGGRQRKRNVLDRFAIDYALCMYCGICVEVCPYDALFWSREFEYAEYDIRQLTHEKERLSDWMESVLPPPPLEPGADTPAPARAAAPSATVGATGARPATASASAVETRPEQAAPAPDTGTAVPEAARPAETVPDETPQATAVETPAEDLEAEVEAEKGVDGAGAAAEPSAPEEPPAEPPVAEPAAGEAAPDLKIPQVQVPTLHAGAARVEPAQDAEAIYREVLEEQLGRGSSPQVAEARAKVARAKAERGIKRGPTPVEVAKPVPSAPTKAEQATPPAEPDEEAVPGGAPRAEEPKPEQGPVAPEEGDEETKKQDG